LTTEYCSFYLYFFYQLSKNITLTSFC